jgi:hypothetical protein
MLPPDVHLFLFNSLHDVLSQVVSCKCIAVDSRHCVKLVYTAAESHMRVLTVSPPH